MLTSNEFIDKPLCIWYRIKKDKLEKEIKDTYMLCLLNSRSSSFLR